jgi:glycyl-tRNA synthetase
MLLLRAVLRRRCFSSPAGAAAATAPSFQPLSMAELQAWCKQRGFVYEGSELYGGIGAGFDYGPLGAALKRNVEAAWWRDFVERRPECVALGTGQLLSPRVWEASGHVAGFADPLSECATCKRRVRADAAVGSALAGFSGAAAALPAWLTGVRDPGALGAERLGQALRLLSVRCACGASGERGFGAPRPFNLLFRTSVGATGGGGDAYLRPETAQGAYVHFLNVLHATRKRLPLGVGQVGTSFRNEIAVGNFLFRTREFEQMELQYFCHPRDSAAAHATWVGRCEAWLLGVAGLRRDSVRRAVHAREELAHYALATTDLEFKFPFGWGELWGVANRGDYDLKAHSAASGSALQYTDPVSGEVRRPCALRAFSCAPL